MTVRRLLVALLLSTCLLAGCTGGGGSAKRDTDGLQQAVEDLDLEATATTGIIRGVVVDDAVRPLADVDIQVAIPGKANRTATSTEAGAFGFDGLEPGTYFVQASKMGYATAQASTEVLAGDSEPPIVKLLLAVDPSTQPYVTALQYDAFIGCSVTTPSASAAVCGLGPLPGITNNRFLVSYDADKPPQWIQTEALWESTQPLGADLSLSITDFSQGAQVGVNSTRGPSPIFLTVNQTDAARFNYGTNNSIVIRLFSTAVTGTDVVPEQQVHAAYAASVYPAINGTAVQQAGQTYENAGFGLTNNPFGNKDCIEYPVLFASCYGFGGVGVVLNQQVTIFTHIYYGYAPPAGWRFSEAQSVPPPQ